MLQKQRVKPDLERLGQTQQDRSTRSHHVLLSITLKGAISWYWAWDTTHGKEVRTAWVLTGTKSEKPQPKILKKKGTAVKQMRTPPHVLHPPQPLHLTPSKFARQDRKERKELFLWKELFFLVRLGTGLYPTFPFQKVQLSNNNKHLKGRDTAEHAWAAHQSHSSYQ